MKSSTHSRVPVFSEIASIIVVAEAEARVSAVYLLLRVFIIFLLRGGSRCSGQPFDPRDILGLLTGVLTLSSLLLTPQTSRKYRVTSPFLSLFFLLQHFRGTISSDADERCVAPKRSSVTSLSAFASITTIYEGRCREEL